MSPEGGPRWVRYKKEIKKGKENYDLPKREFAEVIIVEKLRLKDEDKKVMKTI